MTNRPTSLARDKVSFITSTKCNSVPWKFHYTIPYVSMHRRQCIAGQNTALKSVSSVTQQYIQRTISMITLNIDM